MAKKFNINLKKYITDFEGYKYSISFVGNPNKDFILNVLCELIKTYKKKIHIFCEEKLFLKSIEKIKKEKLLDESCLKIYSKSYEQNVLSENEKALIYSSSKINLCINSLKNPCVDIQIFEALASGGFLIINDRADLIKYFDESRHLEVFRDITDLVDKIDFYLKNYDIAQKITQLGRFEIIKNYSVTLKSKKSL